MNVLGVETALHINILRESTRKLGRVERERKTEKEEWAKEAEYNAYQKTKRSSRYLREY